MNAKQSLKLASKKIEELEWANKLYACDVQAYNAVIEGTVDGKTICEWCEDQNECTKPEKGGKGCHEWMLMWNHQQEEEENDDEETDGGAVDGGAASDGVHRAGGGDGNCLGDLPAGLCGQHQIEAVWPE